MKMCNWFIYLINQKNKSTTLTVSRNDNNLTSHTKHLYMSYSFVINQVWDTLIFFLNVLERFETKETTYDLDTEVHLAAPSLA